MADGADLESRVAHLEEFTNAVEKLLVKYSEDFDSIKSSIENIAKVLTENQKHHLTHSESIQQITSHIETLYDAIGERPPS